jgi:hypothetical protein
VNGVKFERQTNKTSVMKSETVLQVDISNSRQYVSITKLPHKALFSDI